MDRSNGLNFPIIIVDGTVVNPGLLDSIESSLLIILGWIYGTRFFNYAFGSVLFYLLNTPGSESNIAIMKTYIKLAISKHEPRIIVTQLDIVPNNENIKMTVKATVKSTQSQLEFDTIL